MADDQPSPPAQPPQSDDQALEVIKSLLKPGQPTVLARLLLLAQTETGFGVVKIVVTDKRVSGFNAELLFR